MSTHGEVTAHVHRDDVASRMGMWLFLFTELLLIRRPVLSLFCVQFYASGGIPYCRKRTEYTDRDI